MFVVLLNWKSGDNDPFTIFNKALAKYLDECGKISKIIEMTDKSWPSQIVNLKFDGIDFVFGWQGLGTGINVGVKKQNFWDVVKVPLITYHGDHPCHMPLHHTLDSRYCAHIYSNREFCLYANRHFRKQSRTISILCPPMSIDTPLGPREGDFFVFAKNITPTYETESRWKIEKTERLYKFYMTVAETLKLTTNKERHVDFHEILDELVVSHGYEEISVGHDPGAYHRFHSEIDLYIRNYKSECVLSELGDIPLRIFGRGWDCHAKLCNNKHQFFPGKNIFKKKIQVCRSFMPDAAQSLPVSHVFLFKPAHVP